MATINQANYAASLWFDYEVLNGYVPTRTEVIERSTYFYNQTTKGECSTFIEVTKLAIEMMKEYQRNNP